MTDDVPVSKKWPQFSLRFLLFVLPTAAGVLFFAYSMFTAQHRQYQRLMLEKSVLLEECYDAEVRKHRLFIAEHSLDQLIQEHSTPVLVLREIETRPPAGYFSDVDPVYFFLQASDQQLRNLVDLLAEQFPHSHPTVQARILVCLKSIPERVDAERLPGLRIRVRRFVEPLQFDSDDRIRQLAIETLHAFNSPSPLREKN